MLFNSFLYLLIFLPVTVCIYYFLNRRHLNLISGMWLILASFFFYAHWKLSFFPILLASIAVNYLIGRYFSRKMETGRRQSNLTLTLGIAFNISLLGYFKYSDFFIANFNAVFKADVGLLHIALPLGISFFTFQQIAYLVDSFHGRTREYDFVNYCLFVSFFPQLIAGPIVHHKEMMPQFARLKNKVLNWENIYRGLFFIGAGLCKKVVIADTFALWASKGFNEPNSLDFLSAWATSLSYTIQLYFDFSGYTDMAIGSALLININLPQNFNAPYRSLNIQDFWRRWHMTLGRFLRDYIYIPLGGNRKGSIRTYINLFLTFLMAGFWHGAGWTFVLWGSLHGLCLCLHRFWSNLGLSMPKFFAWTLTFLFVNIAWVIFRAESISQAATIIGHMFDISSANWGMLSPVLIIKASGLSAFLFCLVCIMVLQDIVFRTTQEWSANLQPTIYWSLGTAATAIVGVILLMDQNRFSEFIYFQF